MEGRPAVKQADTDDGVKRGYSRKESRRFPSVAQPAEGRRLACGVIPPLDRRGLDAGTWFFGPFVETLLRLADDTDAEGPNFRNRVGAVA